MIVTPLPDNTGFSTDAPFRHGAERSYDSIRGIHYKHHPPAVRFAISGTADGFLQLTCQGCTDQKLMRRDALSLMKALNLLPEDTKQLPTAVRSGGKFVSRSAQAD
ncbi:MAG: hypothetical protein ACEQSB_01505 [Undibacterium sp.]